VACRLPHDRLRESAWLESCGFRFIEMVLRPRIALAAQASAAAPHETLRIERAGLRDGPALEDIAGEAFGTGRLALDPFLDPALNGRRYRRWVRSSLDHPVQQALKATVDGDVAGFFVVEHAGDIAYWHLTAMAPRFQGRGLGEALWRAMLARHRDEGLRAVETTISAHNVPVLNLYAKLGFRFGAAQTTLHWTPRR
jgi:ribosomal protein S18 acetylase RimI-like enzyme